MKIKVTSTDGTTLKTANKFCEEDIHIILDESIKNSGNGANLNIEYANTPPADTSKLWLNCQEPLGVEIQNYLGECAIDEVLEYSTIDNPTTSSYFYYGYFSTCYIGNNQIAIVGYNHIRIYDLTSKSYVDDYTISVGTSEIYTNVIHKDNVLYFVYNTNLYSFNLTTQTLTTLYKHSDHIKYIAFYTDNEIDLYGRKSNNYSFVYRFNLTNNTATQILYASKSSFYYINSSTVKANDTLYNFNTHDPYKYVDNASSITSFTSFTNFIKNTFNHTNFNNSSAIYDNERYIYLIGGGNVNASVLFNNFIKYDTINDTFELLDTKLLSGKYNALSVLVDNRVYMFGGGNSTSSGYGRTNYIDYFDLKYPLNENNAIVTINNSTDSVVTLINEDTIKLKSNVASAYIGNADNLAEKVNAYYHDSKAWLGINTSNPFEWGSLQEQNVFLGETITLEVPLTNNFGWEMIYNVISDLEVSNNSNTLTINGGSALGTYPITVTATSSEYNSVYEKTFNVITNNAITWSTISDQTSTSSNSITLDLSTYYTNNSSYDVTLSASSSDNTNFEVSITGNTLTVNCLAVANTTITIEAIVLGITYSVSFNLTAS